MARTQRPDLPKAIRVSVSMTQEQKDEIQAYADTLPHRNFSAVVVAAVREYLARYFTPKEANDADRAA